MATIPNIFMANSPLINNINPDAYLVKQGPGATCQDWGRGGGGGIGGPNWNRWLESESVFRIGIGRLPLVATPENRASSI